MLSRNSVIHKPALAALAFLLALFVGPGFALADDNKNEGSENTGHYSKFKHGSPHGSPHGKPEGSGKGYGHESGHGYKGGHHGSGHHGHKRDPFSHVLRFAHPLGLSEDQVNTIREKQFQFQKERVELKAQHEIAHMELDKLVHSGNVDESAIRAVGDRIKQIKSQKIDGMINAKITLLQTLTEEQRKKISELHAHGGGKGHGTGHGYKGHH